ncbi:MAG: peptide deformylase [Chloroflexi bacterium GWB2_49_20]|nr:MAG: peptide deformylase [Chloroflexi bacterium GWB2_49_20]OGN79432.1 MAG: peptide deformylase [Chloroflexi bacterium GWC2_49_37]OGN82799.1 MAG: peptide deformylase [Chloroflexi bacterium GWD2_49_16]HCC79699.1 peptide deformylase [Anaerolineae bacterium]HCM97271.1 peptide deformylase [Anaerolineae bacterium]
MSLREIVTIPNPVLRRKAHPVTKFDDELQVLIADMIETMRVAPGVGLAAPQVGISQRVIVVEYTTNEEDETAPKKLFAVVNPEIKITDEETETGVEGCLSLPGLLGEVDRSLAVIVKGLNRQGKPVRIKAQGWLARIFQHEIDHLEGVVFTDKASKIWKPEADEALVDNV